MIIDSHQHFWHYTPDEYGWIDDSMATLRRDFLPDDLAPQCAAAGVDGVISVQARQTIEETRWLLDLARNNDLIRAVVGWAPLTDPNITRVLESLAAEPKFKGVRHVLQGESDERYILRGDFNAGIRALRAFGLVYEILIYERHLPQTIELVDRHPGQVFVVDHIAKPRVRDDVMEPWRTNLRHLAERPNVFCKLSGVVTEADPMRWSEAQVAPYMDAALDAFGPDRLLFGSDWPVCLAACPYGRWLEIVRRTVAGFSLTEQSAILGGNALRVYSLTNG